MLRPISKICNFFQLSITRHKCKIKFSREKRLKTRQTTEEWKPAYWIIEVFRGGGLWLSPGLLVIGDDAPCQKWSPVWNLTVLRKALSLVLEMMHNNKVDANPMCETVLCCPKVSISKIIYIALYVKACISAMWKHLILHHHNSWAHTLGSMTHWAQWSWVVAFSTVNIHHGGGPSPDEKHTCLRKSITFITLGNLTIWFWSL